MSVRLKFGFVHGIAYHLSIGRIMRICALPADWNSFTGGKAQHEDDQKNG